ncbi:MAG: molybdopterin-dependent oxidoreductase [Vicinamibacterales bacterium]
MITTALPVLLLLLAAAVAPQADVRSGRTGPPPGGPRVSVPDLTPPATLSVTGAVSAPLVLAPADLKAMPRTTVDAGENGRTVRYEGVLVGELLRRAGAAVGPALRGDAVASYVVAHAVDGYRAVFALAELDNAFVQNDVLVADTVDGRPLFDYQGPWRLVAPRDLRGARSVRMLDRLEVVRLTR